MKNCKNLMWVATISITLIVTPLVVSASQFQMTVSGTGDFSGVTYNSGILGSSIITTGLLGNPLSSFSIDTAVNNTAENSFLDTVYSAFDHNAEGSGGTVTIVTSATDYMFSTTGTLAKLINSIGGINTNADVTAQTWVNSTNALGGTTGPSITQGPFNNTSFSNQATTQFTSSTPFSITQKIDINLQNLGNASGDFNSNVPPTGSVLDPPSFSPPKSHGLVGTIDPSKPTIVITHGWQLPSVSKPVDWTTTMQTSILANFPNANVLTYTWDDAFVTADNIPDASDHTLDAGLALGLELKALGVNDVQFIGHSLGTYTNAYASEFLTTHGINVDQVTMLDTPGLINNESNFFQQTLQNVGWVDNYYGTQSGLAGATGSIIDGAYNTAVNANHSGVHDYYQQTITDAAEIAAVVGGGVSGTGFFWSLDGGGTALRPDPQASTYLLLSQLPPISFDSWYSNVQTTANSTVATLFNSDPAYLWNSAFSIPVNGKYLSFDFDWTALGNGNYLDVYFNEQLLFDFMGTDFLYNDFINSGLIPISQFAGETGQLLFALIPNGTDHAQVSIRNLQISYSSVPEPPIYTLLLAGFGLLGFMTRRRKQDLTS